MEGLFFPAFDSKCSFIRVVGVIQLARLINANKSDNEKLNLDPQSTALPTQAK